LFSTDFLVSVLLITVTLGLFMHSVEFSLASFPRPSSDAFLLSSALLSQARTQALDPARMSQSGCGGQAGEQAWCYPLLPADGPITSRFSDSIERPQGALSYVLEDGVPLGPGHAEAAVIRSAGAGRFSDRSDASANQHYLLFSSSDGSSPATNGRAYALVYVGVPPGMSSDGFCVYQSVAENPARTVQDNCATLASCPAVLAVERRIACGSASCAFSVRTCSEVYG